MLDGCLEALLVCLLTAWLIARFLDWVEKEPVEGEP